MIIFKVCTYVLYIYIIYIFIYKYINVFEQSTVCGLVTNKCVYNKLLVLPLLLDRLTHSAKNFHYGERIVQ